LLLSAAAGSQDIFLTKPRLVFTDNQLTISYDIIDGLTDDKYFVWVEVVDSDGKILKASNIWGDVGKNISAGNDRKIIWIPEDDSLSGEKIFVQVKAERYVKSYDRNTMLLRSAVLPGWGETRVSNGKPWWLSSFAVYGMLAGSYLYHQRYHKYYDSYRVEENPETRAGYFKISQNSVNVSTAMLYASLSLWISNLIWVTAVPERYKPLQHVELSLDRSVAFHRSAPVFSIKFEF
jgi:hypothetical protein